MCVHVTYLERQHDRRRESRGCRLFPEGTSSILSVHTTDCDKFDTGFYGNLFGRVECDMIMRGDTCSRVRRDIFGSLGETCWGVRRDIFGSLGETSWGVRRDIFGSLGETCWGGRWDIFESLGRCDVIVFLLMFVKRLCNLIQVNLRETWQALHWVRWRSCIRVRFVKLMC